MGTGHSLFGIMRSQLSQECSGARANYDSKAEEGLQNMNANLARTF